MFYKLPSTLELFKNRRNNLCDLICEQNPTIDKGFVLLFAGFEVERYSFRQENSFYYFTGITEPAAVLLMDLDGRDTVYIPHFNQARDQWVNVDLRLGAEKKYLVDLIKHLGKPAAGYSFQPPFTQEKYHELLHDLSTILDHTTHVFTIIDRAGSAMGMQMQLLEKLQQWLPVLKTSTRDIAPLVHKLRRAKDDYEISLMHTATQITQLAHETAASMIVPDKFEYEIQAGIEYVFTQSAGAIPAFPSIVATGKNTTVLHYTDRNHKLQKGDLVVVDIGAEYGYYAADLTRTYPVGGAFSKRQREVYEIVLKTQRYVESIAVPGVFLKNPAHPEKSLHHLAVKFLQDLGYAQYFCHGIGHYLGLDVHDVGDYNTPLEEGDAFTIEPGVYIASERIGVRIEDDYVMTSEGAVCLSAELPKDPGAIEKLMAGGTSESYRQAQV